MSDFLTRLKQRKLMQWAIAYAGGAWLILQLLSLLAQPFSQNEPRMKSILERKRSDIAAQRARANSQK